MRYINLYGSSHTSTKHGFPQTVGRLFSQLGEPFKLKYNLGELRSCPGATFCHDQFLESVVKVSSEQTNLPSFEGQVNVVVIGSNDTREIAGLAQDVVNQALEKFRYKLTYFLDRLLRIENSTVILVTSVIHRLSINQHLENIVDQVLRSTEANRNRAKKLSVHLESSEFKDQVHLNYRGNEILVEQIINAVKFVPKSAFLNTPYSPSLNLSDIAQFPKLSGKRHFQTETRIEKMPKFPKSSKKFKTLVSPSDPSTPPNQQMLQEIGPRSRTCKQPQQKPVSSVTANNIPVSTTDIPNSSCINPDTITDGRDPLRDIPAANSGIPAPFPTLPTLFPTTPALFPTLPAPFPTIPPPIPTIIAPIPVPFTDNLASFPAPFSGIIPDNPATAVQQSPTVQPTVHNHIDQVSSRTGQGFTLHENHGDLFAQEIPGAFCQSVSKDMKMTRGIAPKFKEVFKNLSNPRMKKIADKNGVGGVAILKHNNIFVYNLITKARHFQHPISLEILKKSLRKMRNHSRAHKVLRINMPRISSGLDGLKWENVRNIIKDVFKGEHIDIWVYEFSPKRKTSLSRENNVVNSQEYVELENHLEESDTKLKVDEYYEKAIVNLKKELNEANKLIEILITKAGSEDLKDISGLSEKAKKLVKSGKLSFSSLYTVMVDLESELKSTEAANEKLTDECGMLKTDMTRLSHVEDEITEIKAAIEDLKEAMDIEDVSDRGMQTGRNSLITEPTLKVKIFHIHKLNY